MRGCVDIGEDERLLRVRGSAGSVEGYTGDVHGAVPDGVLGMKRYIARSKGL